MKDYDFSQEMEDARQEWLRNVTNEELDQIDINIKESKKNANSCHKEMKAIILFAVLFILLSLFSLYALIPVVFSLIHIWILIHNYNVHIHMYESHKKDKEDCLKSLYQ